MALIERKKEIQKDRVKIEMSSEILSKIDEYMKWADIDDLGYFLEESAMLVFKSDRDWKKHQKQSKLEKV